VGARVRPLILRAGAALAAGLAGCGGSSPPAGTLNGTAVAALGPRETLITKPMVSAQVPPQWHATTRLPGAAVVLEGPGGQMCTVTGTGYRGYHSVGAEMHSLRVGVARIHGASILRTFTVQGRDGTSGRGVVLHVPGLNTREALLHHGRAAAGVDCQAPPARFAASEGRFEAFLASVEVAP
jgi:hypothetical protein